MTVLGSKTREIELGRVYRRREFAERPPTWVSQKPSLEIKGAGSVTMYVSNLPRFVESEGKYTSPISDNVQDIKEKMTVIKDCTGTPLKFCEGLHEATLSTVWVCFLWNNDSEEPPTLLDSSIVDWELALRQDMKKGIK